MTLPWERAEREAGLPGLVERLGSLAPSALTSLLLMILKRQAERDPADVLRQHERDAFVRPSDIDTRAMLALDALVAQAVPAAFEAVELSPVAPLGTCSAMGRASQDKILSASRGVEVLADPTNALALLAAQRRRAGAGELRLCAVQRVVRAQRVTQPGFSQHFRLWGFITAGRDPGGRAFESAALAEHLALHGAILRALAAAGFATADHRFRAYVAPSQRSWAQAALPEGVELLPLPEEGYYAGLRVQVEVSHPELGWLPLADGGLVDWLARLRSDRKEKLFISGIGTELILRKFRA